jgi:hypothetical protein
MTKRTYRPNCRAALVGLLAAATSLTGCTSTMSGSAQPAGSARSTPEQATAFGPDGFGRLTLDMTEQQALATGDLGPSPITIDEACKNYSFAGGPAPDPARIAADEKLEEDYAAAEKAARGTRPKPGSKASAQDHADSAAAASDLAELDAELADRSLARVEAFTGAGGASFGAGALRVLIAPPGVTTAAGIGRGSTVEQLKAAYQGDGLKSSSEDRFEFPAPGRPGWSFTFDVADGKVAYFMLRNPSVGCG